MMQSTKMRRKRSTGIKIRKMLKTMKMRKITIWKIMLKERMRKNSTNNKKR